MVRKFLEAQDQFDGAKIKLTVPAIYDHIKNSNSSLNRKAKRLLENSIERVIAVAKQDEAEDDETSIEGDFAGMEEAPPVQVRIRECSR